MKLPKVTYIASIESVITSQRMRKSRTFGLCLHSKRSHRGHSSVYLHRQGFNLNVWAHCYVNNLGPWVNTNILAVECCGIFLNTIRKKELGSLMFVFIEFVTRFK